MKSRKAMQVMAVALTAVLMIGAAQASIYVDAGVGNTYRASDDDPSAWQTTDNASDGLWRYRAGFGNKDDFTLGAEGNEIFETNGSSSSNPWSEDGVALYTVVSGLTVGQEYAVDVVFWSPDSSASWTVRAGFALDSLTYFDDNSASAVYSGKKESDREEWLGRVGTFTADSTSINIYIDDKVNAGGNYDRTWYDGVLVTEVPEPATMVLLGLGGLVALKRRK